MDSLIQAALPTLVGIKIQVIFVIYTVNVCSVRTASLVFVSCSGCPVELCKWQFIEPIRPRTSYVTPISLHALTLQFRNIYLGCVRDVAVLNDGPNLKCNTHNALRMSDILQKRSARYDNTKEIVSKQRENYTALGVRPISAKKAVSTQKRIGCNWFGTTYCVCLLIWCEGSI